LGEGRKEFDYYCFIVKRMSWWDFTTDHCWNIMEWITAVAVARQKLKTQREIRTNKANSRPSSRRTCPLSLSLSLSRPYQLSGDARDASLRRLFTASFALFVAANEPSNKPVFFCWHSLSLSIWHSLSFFWDSWHPIYETFFWDSFWFLPRTCERKQRFFELGDQLGNAWSVFGDLSVFLKILKCFQGQLEIPRSWFTSSKK